MGCCTCRYVLVPGAEMAVTLGAVAAGNRDVELGIAPHTVLVHVETLRLDFGRDPDAPDLVQHPETAERRSERERADGDEAERLHAELMEAPAVHKALRARCKVRRQDRNRKEPAGERAPDA